MWVEIQLKNAKNFLVGSIYRPPITSQYLPKKFNDTFSEVLDIVNKEDIECIILGDLNTNYLIGRDSKEVKDIIILNGFDQLITKPTRTTSDSSTLIDVVLSNKKVNVSITDVFPLSLSDHDMIGCVRKLNHIKYEPRTITCRNYTSYDSNNLCKDISSLDLTLFYEMKDTNKAWVFLKDHLTALFNKHAPIITKKVKGRHCPWLTTDVKKQMNNKDKLLRKARLTKSKGDFAMYKTAKNLCNNMVKIAKRNYHHALINENKHNPRKFWKSIKAVFSGDNIFKLSIPYLEDNEFSPKNNESKANIYCSFFTNVAKSLKEQSFQILLIIYTTISKFRNLRFITKQLNFVFIIQSS